MELKESIDREESLKKMNNLIMAAFNGLEN